MEVVALRPRDVWIALVAGNRRVDRRVLVELDPVDVGEIRQARSRPRTRAAVRPGPDSGPQTLRQCATLRGERSPIRPPEQGPDPQDAQTSIQAIERIRTLRRRGREQAPGA